MTYIPDTTSKRTRRWPRIALLATVVVVALVALSSLLPGRSFSPGEEISSPKVERVAASLEDGIYPPKDILLFEGGPEAVYVYIAVRDLDPEAGVRATVERDGNETFLSKVFGPEDGIEVVEGNEEQLAPSEEGVSGVIKLKVRNKAQGALPPGNYTVGVASGGSEMVEKRFVIR